MSISAPREPRSEALSGERRKPEAGGNRARMPGKPTCAGRPTRSITEPLYLLPRGSGSTYKVCYLPGQWALLKALRIKYGPFVSQYLIALVRRVRVIGFAWYSCCLEWSDWTKCFFMTINPLYCLLSI